MQSHNNSKMSKSLSKFSEINFEFDQLLFSVYLRHKKRDVIFENSRRLKMLCLIFILIGSFKIQNHFKEFDWIKNYPR